MRLTLVHIFFSLSLLFCSPLHAYNVGVLDFDPPYVYSPSQGFDIDLTKAICTRLKTQCHLIPMNYHQFFTALTNGQIDFAIGAIFINNDPQYLFSLPYIVGLGQFMALKSSPIQTVNDLKNKITGVLEGNPSGSAFVDFLNKKYPGQFQIKDFGSVNDLVTALSNHEIAAAYLRHSSVRYWTQSDTGLFKPLGPVDTVGEGMGVMSIPQNSALIQQINVILKQMEADGSYLALYNMYFLSSSIDSYYQLSYL